VEGGVCGLVYELEVDLCRLDDVTLYCGLES
jgi:hypothetical protein